MALKLYNTLTRSVENFEPLHPPKVTMYTCGPTVYDYQHIGHMRRYVGDDILVRVLRFNNYDVTQVMNITDVGHLTSDSDTGQDKMEKGAAKFGKSVWDIAKMFEQQFFASCKALNIQKPNIILHATATIADQIELIKVLEEKGFTYRIDDGIYFDTSKFPHYNKLSHQDLSKLKEGARVEAVAEKKNPTDFALWKFSPSDAKREMEWDSPWGKGFPGWHIECSAMAMKEFGATLDIHTGGIDHIPIHHTNEIAQSEAATGKEFVHFWVHHNFLMVDGTKMSKSLGNLYTVQDIVENGSDPLSLRYLYLQTHYRQEMNFTWESLTAAQTALHRLYEIASSLPKDQERVSQHFHDAFVAAVNDDLNMPKALSVVWEMMGSNMSENEKSATLLEMDKVLGLNLDKKIGKRTDEKIPGEVMDLVKRRERLRKEKKFDESDRMREEIRSLGYELNDRDDSTTDVKKI